MLSAMVLSLAVVSCILVSAIGEVVPIDVSVLVESASPDLELELQEVIKTATALAIKMNFFMMFLLKGYIIKIRFHF